MRFKLHNRRKRALAVLFGAGVLLVSGATPAYADTSAASARAVRIGLGGGTLLSSGFVSAQNDGSGEVKTGDTTPALSILGDQDVIVAGVLAQDAQANSDGTSAACAGLVASGGQIQIGEQGSCLVTTSPGGVVLDLIPDVLTLRADAITAECTSASDGTVTGSATIVNGVFDLLIEDITLDVSPQPNTGLNIPGLASVILNQQSITENGSIIVNALDINVLNDTLRVTIGSVFCGPNADTDPIPVIPAAGIPLAFATAAALGGAAWLVQRRRRSSLAGA